MTDQPLTTEAVVELAADLTNGVAVPQNALTLFEVRQAIEAVYRETPGNFPNDAADCAGCGARHAVPGRWFLVSERLHAVHPLSNPNPYFRCPFCGSILFVDELDPLVEVLDFFQLEKNPLGGPPLVKQITYRPGGLGTIMDMALEDAQR